MARELHSDSIKTEQHAPIFDHKDYDGDIVLTERIESSDYAEALAFMEEPVTIRLHQSSDKNAAGAFPVWVNGKAAEVLVNGRWLEFGYLPVGQVLTIKRKVLEVIIRAKIDTVYTRVQGMDSERPNNMIQRDTTPVHSYSIILDKNPRGPAWVEELIRRNI